MHVANVPVYLGQVIYTQHGQEFGQATVNQDSRARRRRP